MNDYNHYCNFCKLFNFRLVPKFKFKDLTEEYKFLYKERYNLDESNVNQATFCIFLFSSLISMIISFIIVTINILIIILYSLLFSLILSYNFNTLLYRKLKREESIINSILYLIKVNFSLLKKTYHKNSDLAIIFIQLISRFNLPIKSSFKHILIKIHEGKKPEDLLLRIKTPSEDFNKYLIDLLTNTFSAKSISDKSDDTSSEKNFKILLRDIETKISIIFFIGLFIPIGLCFLILFQRINFIAMIIFLPLFLILIRFLFQKLVKIDIFLLGVLKGYSNAEKRKYEEFLLFLKNFAYKLRTSISPELAFVKTYFDNKSFLKHLRAPIEKNINQVLNFNYTFDNMLNDLKLELNDLRYILLLDTIQRMLKENAYSSSKKIIAILKIITKHRRLEEKLKIIIRGERFKVFMFLFLLPIITGAIGGMFPLIVLLSNNQEFNIKDYMIISSFDIIKFILIFTTLLITNLISSFYFLKIIEFEKKYVIVSFSVFLYVIVFFLTFINLSIIF